MLRSSALLPALVLAAVAVPATGDVAFNTFGPADSFGGFALTRFGGTPLPPTAAAVKFTTTWPGHVQRISAALSCTGSSTKRMEIWTDHSSGQYPAAPVVVVNFGGVTAIPGIVSVNFPTEPLLQPGTYWLIIRDFGPFPTSWYPGQTNGIWYLQDPNVGSWLPVDSTQPAAKIELDPIAACCATDAKCVVMRRSECGSFRGACMGPGSVCSPIPCSVLGFSGACCRGLNCTVTSPVACIISPGGRFLGPNSTCTPLNGANLCCPADFNNTGELTAQDLFDFLTAFFSPCP